jgi:hypothetical protein
MTEEDDSEFQFRLFEATIAFDDSPEKLARYIEKGGELDKGMRKRLASMIRQHFPRPRGGKNPTSDVELYMFLEDWRLQEPINRVIDKLKRRIGSAPEPQKVFDALPKLLEPVTVEDGLQHVIDTGAFGTTPDTDINGLRKKYNRGKKLVTGE